MRELDFKIELEIEISGYHAIYLVEKNLIPILNSISIFSIPEFFLKFISHTHVNIRRFLNSFFYQKLFSLKKKTFQIFRFLKKIKTLKKTFFPKNKQKQFSGSVNVVQRKKIDDFLLCIW